MIKSVFWANLFERRTTIEKLLEESRVDADYYLFLLFSSFITTLGLVFGNAVIIIAGMLIVPILSPVLSLGMGFATVSRKAIGRATGTIVRSGLVILVVSYAIAFLSGAEKATSQMLLASQPDVWLFLIAFFSGVVASYSWIKKSESISLPSIALAVSLIVPLSAVGISLALSPFSRELFSGALVLFLINLLGIVVSSVLVFLLFGFSNLQRWQEQKITEETLDIAEEKQEKKKEQMEHALKGDVQ